jgi:hypothetical protein
LVKDAGEVNALVPAFPLLFSSDDDAFPPAKYSACTTMKKDNKINKRCYK